MPADARERARDKIVSLCGSGLDVVALWRECREPLASAVPHHMAPCWYTLDPASLLVTSHFEEGIAAMPAEWLEHEYLVDGVHKLVDVARSPDGLSTLHDLTGGDPTSTLRWQANMALGGDQEMIAALRTRSGEVWGAVGLYRDPGREMFDDADKAFLRSVAAPLAEGVRRGLLHGEALDPDHPAAPGLVLLDGSLGIETITDDARRWLADMPDGDLSAGRLPSAVVGVAARARRSGGDGAHDGPAEPDGAAVARVRCRSGAWVVVHGLRLSSADPARVAVIVERPHPARISALLMSVYGLTEREKDVSRLVLSGCSTAEIADTLALSPHTVQQHLSNVFDKTGVRSRRDLAGKVFFAHYEPRLRDNENRAQHARPLRGGPVDPAGRAHRSARG